MTGEQGKEGQQVGFYGMDDRLRHEQPQPSIRPLDHWYRSSDVWGMVRH